MVAAYNAMEMALRMIKPTKGLKNADITEQIMKIAKTYETIPVENMLSQQMERFKPAADKQIIQNPAEDQKSKIEKCTFEEYEVYAIDILISSGEG
jgi:methionine aminopeptidase